MEAARMLRGLVVLAALFRTFAAPRSNQECHQLNFVIAAKQEVHVAKQTETAGGVWFPSEYKSASSFIRSPNFQLCIRDVASKLRSISQLCEEDETNCSQPVVDRRSMGVLEWLHRLTQLPTIMSAIDGPLPPLEAFAALGNAFPGLQPGSRSLEFRHTDEEVLRSVEAFRDAVVPNGPMSESGNSGDGRDLGDVAAGHVRVAAGGAAVKESSIRSEAGDVLHIQRLGAVMIGGQSNELQLEVVAAQAQQRPVVQITRAGEALLKVGSTGDMQLRGGLFVGSTQDALSSSNSALVSAGGLSVAKGAVIGGRVRVDETQDAASTGAGALQVAGGLAVGKRAFFGGSVFVGRQSGSGTGARKLEVYSADGEATVVVQTGAPDKPAALELWGAGPVARIANVNGSVVLDAGGSGFRIQGGATSIIDESDLLLGEGGQLSASMIVRGGASVGKAMHVAGDLSVGSGFYNRAGSQGRAVRVSASSGPAEVVLIPGAKAAAKLHLGRGGSIQGEAGVVEIVAGVQDEAGGSHGRRTAGSLVLSAAGADGVQLTHGRLKSGSGTVLQLEGQEGAQLASQTGEVLLQARGANGTVRLRAGEGPGLTLQARGRSGEVDLRSDHGIRISALDGDVSLLAEGDRGGSLRIHSNGSGKQSVSIGAPWGGVFVHGGAEGLELRSDGDAMFRLSNTSSSFRVETAAKGVADVDDSDAMGVSNTCASSAFAVRADGKVSVAGGVVAGTVQLHHGAGTVLTPAVTRSSIILLTPVALRFSAPHHIASSKTEGVGFEISAVDSDGRLVETDASTLNWLVLDALPGCEWRG